MPLSALFAVRNLTYQLILVNLLMHANDALEELSNTSFLIQNIIQNLQIFCIKYMESFDPKPQMTDTITLIFSVPSHNIGTQAV